MDEQENTQGILTLVSLLVVLATAHSTLFQLGMVMEFQYRVTWDADLILSHAARFVMVCGLCVPIFIFFPDWQRILWRRGVLLTLVLSLVGASVVYAFYNASGRSELDVAIAISNFVYYGSAWLGVLLVALARVLPELDTKAMTTWRRVGAAAKLAVFLVFFANFSITLGMANFWQVTLVEHRPIVNSKGEALCGDRSLILYANSSSAVIQCYQGETYFRTLTIRGQVELWADGKTAMLLGPVAK